LLFFGPPMLAFALALVYVKGLQQLVVLPLLAAFLLMITALTYQFQGWLALLMSNPRRRRALVVGLTMGIVLIFQLPNLVNIYFTPRFAQRQAARSQAQMAEITEIQQAKAAGEIDAAEATRRQNRTIEHYKVEGDRETGELTARLQGIAWIANAVVPVGWLPVGVMSSAEGEVLPALLGLAGMTLIGSISLWMAYRSTLAQFQGQSSNRKVRAAAPASTQRDEGDRRPRGRLLEARLPGLSEPVSAIALAGFRSVLRSPEAKITLLAPLIMGGVFGSMLLQGGQSMPVAVRPLFGIAAITFVLFGLLQLMGNQFGIDRDGFRVFVLCAAPRRDILLGKNLAFVPVALLISAILVGAVLFICPMRLDHALSMVPQFVSMFLLFCAMANLFSIYAPVFINVSSLKPANPKTSTILLQLLMFMILFPICQVITLIPVGTEAALNAAGLAEGLPVCLLLALAECVAVLVFYHFSLGWLGNCLQAREQKILETVTNRVS
jgi:ABC-2 type transport system permease protein